MLLAGIGIAFGLWVAPVHLLLIFDVIQPQSLVQLAIDRSFRIVTVIVALAVAWAIPQPLQERRTLGAAVGIGGGVAVVQGALAALGGTTFLFYSVFVVSLVVGFSAFVLLALRAHPSRQVGPRETTQYVLLTFGIVMAPLFETGFIVTNTAAAVAQNAPLVAVAEASPALIIFAVAGLWGWNMVRAGPDTVRLHLAAMLGILAMFAVGAVHAAAFPDVAASRSVAMGLTQALGVGLLAYGVLRYDLAGLDAKVRWGVSKTTLAGIFIAVFFIVSEGAQQFFAATALGPWLGIVAAGALLFALSPIQRLADRIAKEVVPASEPGGAVDAAGPRAERTYKEMARRVLKDGEFSREDERALADLASELGLDPSRALQLREQVEEALEGDG